MPNYDYECRKCKEVFEHFQSITAKPLTDCPHCKAAGTLHRLIGRGAGVIFKGTGFYETDYKSKSAPKSDCASSSSCKSCPGKKG